jgi:hypothetical protein
MEMKFREAGHFSQLLQFHRAIQVLANIVDDPINSLDIFAVGLGFLVWHGSSSPSIFPQLEYPLNRSDNNTRGSLLVPPPARNVKNELGQIEDAEPFSKLRSVP